MMATESAWLLSCVFVLCLLPLHFTHEVRIRNRRGNLLTSAELVLAPRVNDNGGDLVTHRELDRELRNLRKEMERMIENSGRGGGGGGGGRGRGGGLSDLIRLRNNYYLAFRATAGAGRSVYETYVSEPHDDDTYRRGALPCGCLSVTKRRPCDRHYKSRIITFWELFKIDRVRVSVYNRGREQVFFEFEGRGTTSLNFFSAENLVDSSFTDAERASSSNFNYFSIQGHERIPEVQRRFFINRRYGGNCQQDEGWLLVLDTPDACDYSRRQSGIGGFPAILYSAGFTSQPWATGNIENGDALVVAVKFRNNFNPNNVMPSGQCLGSSGYSFFDFTDDLR